MKIMSKSFFILFVKNVFMKISWDNFFKLCGKFGLWAFIFYFKVSEFTKFTNFYQKLVSLFFKPDWKLRILPNQATKMFLKTCSIFLNSQGSTELIESLRSSFRVINYFLNLLLDKSSPKKVFSWIWVSLLGMKILQQNDFPASLISTLVAHTETLFCNIFPCSECDSGLFALRII